MVELVVFLVLTAGGVILSWGSLRNPGEHGFYRFFAFEAVFLLVASNFSTWFQHPFSAFQVVSWILLAASLFLAAHGFSLLHRLGQPTGGIESTTELVTAGAYRYIRHPLYGSLLWFAWGVFFKSPSLVDALLGLVATTFLYATATVEEVENLRRFGPAYAAYMQRTRRFIPFLF